ncbi:MAG: heme A synthase [Candidatus Eisenbacteria bacterium]
MEASADATAARAAKDSGRRGTGGASAGGAGASAGPGTAAGAESRPGLTDVLAIGFATTVAMWGIGYVSRMPPVWVPSSLLVVLLLGCMAAGGFYAGRTTGRGWRAGVYTGFVSSLLNLLILGSLLSGSAPGHLVPSALWWVPGSFLLAMALGGAGAALGAARASSASLEGRLAARPDWTSLFAGVAVAATFLLLIVGGLVTSHGAGLAVVDWPNSFGYNMFLYPLSRMSGGVYYEHAHRLFGSLVGLTTLVLTIHLLRADRRAWLKRFAIAALFTVLLQGLIGGLRVTGRFTMSQSPADTAPSLGLAVVHGVLGQIFFSMIVALAVFTSPTWKSEGRRVLHTASASTDRGLSAALVVMLLVQLVLGAVQRHLSQGLLIHITMASLVFLLALFLGVRAWAMHAAQPLLRRIGKSMVLIVCAQVLLGIGALVGKGIAERDGANEAFPVVIRTAHQAGGALLLATAILLALWTRRLLSEREGGRAA